jgi:hypothetical protein
MHDVFTHTEEHGKNHPQWSHACFTARDNNIEFIIKEQEEEEEEGEKGSEERKWSFSHSDRKWRRKTCKRNFVYFHHPSVL